jgi:hypothetical protein
MGILASLLASPLSCAIDGPPRANTSAVTTLVRTELFFGLSRPDGRPEVTDAEFARFLDEEVTPRFPAGFTVLTARGQWREADGDIAVEPSRVLVILHERTEQADRDIDAIRDRYKARFNQEAVMRTDSTERVTF